MALQSEREPVVNKGMTRTALLSNVMAALIVILLAAFFGLTVRNSAEVNELVDTIESGPYVVSNEAGRVETCLVQLQTLAERSIYTRTDAAIDDVERSYAEVDEVMQASVDFIAEHHINVELREALDQGYAELLVLQEEYIALCRNPEVTDAEIEAFVYEKIIPKIDDLLYVDARIFDVSTARVAELCALVDDLGRQNIVMACILMTAVFASLVVFLTLLRKNRKREEQLMVGIQDALELAQAANKAKSHFLSNMSHDIRTPMNAIVGLTNIAESHIDEPHRVRECLERIKISSNHLLSLINDVLDMSKIESGKIVLNDEQFSLPDFMSGIVTIVQPQARAKNLRLDIVIGNVKQESVIGDRLRLDQAILNLTSNAIKYTPEGGTVRLAMSEEDSPLPGCRNYRIVVQDTGIGMSPEFLERIFDPFERERNSTASHTDGVGLGMPITKNVLDMMGGTIQVESVLGKGTTITVVVPLKAADEAGEEVDLSELRGVPVLVVDDDTDVLESTQLILDEIGLRSETATCGADAVDLAVAAHRADDSFRAIIMDWIMPGMDGIETIRRIRDEVGTATPIILLTAYDWTEIEDEAKKAGVTAFISKPLFKSRLCHALKVLCGENATEEPFVDVMEERTEEKISGRVLLVEDNPLNSEIATELIAQFGIEVDQAFDGQEAVDMLAATPDGHYGLVFMDVQMPRMDGIEATRQICDLFEKSARKRPPIVAMTANAFDQDRESAIAAGMDGFMTKPINMDELKHNLRTYLG